MFKGPSITSFLPRTHDTVDDTGHHILSGKIIQSPQSSICSHAWSFRHWDMSGCFKMWWCIKWRQSWLSKKGLWFIWVSGIFEGSMSCTNGWVVKTRIISHWVVARIVRVIQWSVWESNRIVPTIVSMNEVTLLSTLAISPNVSITYMLTHLIHIPYQPQFTSLSRPPCLSSHPLYPPLPLPWSAFQTMSNFPSSPKFADSTLGSSRMCIPNKGIGVRGWIWLKLWFNWLLFDRTKDWFSRSSLIRKSCFIRGVAMVIWFGVIMRFFCGTLLVVLLYFLLLWGFCIMTIGFWLFKIRFCFWLLVWVHNHSVVL